MKLDRLFECLDQRERAVLLAYVAETIPASVLLQAVAEVYQRQTIDEIQDLGDRLGLMSTEMKGMGL